MSKKVLLTGITGYVGSHCALELIKSGYFVKGSLRDVSKANQIKDALDKEVNTAGKLDFCQLDLLKDEGWEEAMEGCDYVLHVASPFINSEPKDENVLVKPALEGTKRALSAAKKAGIKRIVLTSSMVAMLENADESININAESWTNIEAKNVSAYIKSKTIAEKFAWEFINEQDNESALELVVINPGPVFGPTFTGTMDGASLGLFNQMMSGKMPMVPKAAINMSDVRDIAKIHVLALENKNASGNRFIVTTETPYKFQEMAQILKSNGYEKVSTKEAPNFLLNFLSNFNREAKGMRAFIGKTYHGDVSSTMKVFDWKPITFEKTVLDTAKSIEKFSGSI